MAKDFRVPPVGGLPAVDWRGRPVVGLENTRFTRGGTYNRFDPLRSPKATEEDDVDEEEHVAEEKHSADEDDVGEEEHVAEEEHAADEDDVDEEEHVAEEEHAADEEHDFAPAAVRRRRRRRALRQVLPWGWGALVAFLLVVGAVIFVLLFALRRHNAAPTSSTRSTATDGDAV